MCFARWISSSNVYEFAADIMDKEVREGFEVISLSIVSDDSDVFNVS